MAKKKDKDDLTEREKYLVDALGASLRLLDEIAPLATAYLRDNSLNDNVTEAAHKFLADYERYRIRR